MADILWSDVVGAGTIADGGKVGDLLTLAMAHIANEMNENRLTQENAGQVYSALIPAAFQHAMNFTLQEQLTEAQIEKGIQEAAIAKAQADKEYALMLASIDKVYGFDYALDANYDVIRSSLTDTADGKIDYETMLMEGQAAEMVATTIREDKKVDLSKIPSVLK